MKKIYLQMNRFSKSFWILILTIFCISLTITSTILQDLLNLMPCPYCIFQRTLYLIIGIFSALLLTFNKVLKIKINAVSKSILSIIFILSLLGICAAVYQSAMQLFPKALANKVVYVPGDPFYINTKDVNAMRLNYTNADCATIDKGIKRLAGLLKDI